jgi:hypothetical protein
VPRSRPSPTRMSSGSATARQSPLAGVKLGQQIRRQFGLAYRTKVGNDLDGSDHGYKLHLVYGALAAPSEKAYATINDSPEAIYVLVGADHLPDSGCKLKLQADGADRRRQYPGGCRRISAPSREFSTVALRMTPDCLSRPRSSRSSERAKPMSI